MMREIRDHVMRSIRGRPKLECAESAEDAREVAMHAIAVNEYGANPALVELPKPQPGPRQVLIKVRAAGMNPGDRQISDGVWKIECREPSRSCWVRISRGWSNPWEREQRSSFRATRS